MIIFRVSQFKIFSFSRLRAFLQNPYLYFLFLYFLVSSVDLMNLQLLIFKVKPTIFFSLTLLVLCFVFNKFIKIPAHFLVLVFCMLCSMLISSLNSYNMVACLGFMAFFLFSFIVYFVVP